MISKARTLAAGNIFSAVITFATLPILTRLYTPKEYELFAIYMSLLTLITAISNFRFNIAISIPEEDEDGAALLCLSIISGLSLSLFILLFGIIFRERLFEEVFYPSIVWFLAIGVTFSSVYQAMTYWFSRKKRYGEVAFTKVSRATAGSVSQIFLGLSNFGPLGLLLGHQVLLSFGVLGLCISAYKKDLKLIKGAKNRILSIAISFKHFVTFSVPETLANSLGSQLPILIIAIFAAGEEGAFLAISVTILSAPVGLIGQAIHQVFLAEGSRTSSERELQIMIESNIRYVSLFGAPLLLLVVLIFQVLVPVIFGAAWSRVAEVMWWILPWQILQLIVLPISSVFHIKGQLKKAMYLQFLGSIIRIFPLIIAVFFLNQNTIEIFAVCSAIFYFIYLCEIVRASRS